MNIVTIIPARGGSKSIPNKNIMDFCGKPLIAWSIEHALGSASAKDVYVSTDDADIARISIDHGAKVIKRPSYLATDTASSESALLHALDQIELKKKDKVGLVTFLQCTSPLREPEDIDGAVETFVSQGADSVFSCTRLGEFPFDLGHVWEQTPKGLTSLNFDFQHRKRRQDMNPQYIENGSIYVFHPQILRTYNNRIGGKIAMYEMDFWKSWEIDSPGDKVICEWFMRNRLLPQRISLSPNEIDLIVYDFDGVMTDNGVIVLQDGTEGIRANRSDGLGIAMLRKKGISQIIFSTESNPVVKARAQKLKLPIRCAVKDKKSCLQKYCSKNGISLSRVVYVGNDINDLEVMSIVGYPVAPANAHHSVRKIAKSILTLRGGDGAIRELADAILGEQESTNKPNGIV